MADIRACTWYSTRCSPPRQTALCRTTVCAKVIHSWVLKRVPVVCRHDRRMCKHTRHCHCKGQSPSILSRITMLGRSQISKIVATRGSNNVSESCTQHNVGRRKQPNYERQRHAGSASPTPSPLPLQSLPRESRFRMYHQCPVASEETFFFYLWRIASSQLTAPGVAPQLPLVSRYKIREPRAKLAVVGVTPVGAGLMPSIGARPVTEHATNSRDLSEFPRRHHPT